MCQILPSRVVAVNKTTVEVELANGERTRVDCSLKSDVAIGDYVLVDRGLVVDTLTEQEAHAILEIYREIGELLEAEDALA